MSFFHSRPFRGLLAGSAALGAALFVAAIGLAEESASKPKEDVMASEDDDLPQWLREMDRFHQRMMKMQEEAQKNFDRMIEAPPDRGFPFDHDFFKPPAMPRFDQFAPEFPTGPIFSRRWNYSSSSSWRQNGDRFAYSETIRGLKVTLQGQSAGEDLTVEQILIDDGRQTRKYAQVADAPAEHQDEVQTAVEHARRQAKASRK